MTVGSESPKMKRLVDQTLVLLWSCYRAEILEKEIIENAIERCHHSNLVFNLGLELRGSVRKT